ncbi:MAG TPA: ABC transporter substrate-binding protein [Firmicutes bacterium]|nr:ABC transporter substrate-binding protein [Bacillota bacterium]
MKTMKKISSIALVTVLILSMLAGCGQSPAATTDPPPASTAAPSESSAPPAETELTGTLKVSLWDMATQPAFGGVIDGFTKANPGVTIDPIDIPSADYGTKLSVMLNGGSELDAFWIKDADTIYPIAQRGQMVDLSSYIAKNGIDLADYNGLAENFSIDGKQLAIPFRTDYYVLYYNKDIFDAAKVDYPANDMTWSGFEELAKKVTSGSGTDKKYGAHFHTWQACIQNWAVQDGKNTIMATDYGFFKPYYEMALRMQNDDKTCMDFGTLKTSNLHYNSVYPDGSAAMMPMGTWFSATMIDKVNKGESSVNWGIATLPHPEGVEAGNTVGSTTPLAVNAASKNQDLAWEFVKFATGPEGAAIVANLGAIPARLDDATLKTIAAVPGMPEGALEALQVKNIVLDRPIADKVSEVNKMLGDQHALIILGEVTVDEGLSEMAAQSKSIQGK